MIRSQLPGLLLLAVASPTPAAASPAAVPAAAVLRDQLGAADSLASKAGRPQVVFVVSARRLRRLKEWELELDRRLEGIGFMRIADVDESEANRPTYEEVAATLRKRVPQPVRVLVDLDRIWAGALSLDTREVNVLAFDASGAEVARARGRPRPEALAAIESALLRLPGVQRKPPARGPGTAEQ
jgi:hypothetical protein